MANAGASTRNRRSETENPPSHHMPSSMPASWTLVQPASRIEWREGPLRGESRRSGGFPVCRPSCFVHWSELLALADANHDVGRLSPRRFLAGAAVFPLAPALSRPPPPPARARNVSGPDLEFSERHVLVRPALAPGAVPEHGEQYLRRPPAERGDRAREAHHPHGHLRRAGAGAEPNRRALRHPATESRRALPIHAPAARHADPAEASPGP